jgi:hypothetical protein
VTRTAVRHIDCQASQRWPVAARNKRNGCCLPTPSATVSPSITDTTNTLHVEASLPAAAAMDGQWLSGSSASCVAAALASRAESCHRIIIAPSQHPSQSAVLGNPSAPASDVPSLRQHRCRRRARAARATRRRPSVHWLDRASDGGLGRRSWWTHRSAAGDSAAKNAETTHDSARCQPASQLQGGRTHLLDLQGAPAHPMHRPHWPRPLRLNISDKNRRYIGTSQSNRPPKRTQRPPHLPTERRLHFGHPEAHLT